MAEGKNSFILYSDWKELFEALDDAQCSKLVRHIFRYVNDENPDLDDPLLKPVWLIMQPVLKRDLKNWQNKIDKRSEAGKVGGIKSGESRKSKQMQANEANASSVKQTKQMQANEAVNVNDNVNVNVIRESTAHTLEKSNLFRKPTIPTFEEVHRAFLQRGGNEEMAQKFYDKHSTVDWFLNGSPIKNFTGLIPSFIENWKRYESDKNGKLGTSEARIEALKKW